MSYIVESVDSALSLLTLVAEHPGLGVTELSNRLGINKSRAFRLLHTLEAHRFVILDAKTSTYALGPQAFVVGVAAAAQDAVVRTAHRHMLLLNQQVNETIILRVREGQETVCVARCETSHEMRIIGRVGNRRPLWYGAAGKVLLAFAPQEVRAQYLGKVKQLAAESLGPEPQVIAEQIAAVQQKGYATSFGEVTPGAAAVSVPVRDVSGMAVAALSISGPDTRITARDVPQLLEPLLACAASIGRELGYNPPPP
ncbi:IclR family transcriptional regulator [Ralstonia flaminis]|jgi:IclR family KDG regulon transcriptional repressor|uniref:Pectin degradation repressor protein KdgR n=2 Tax=Pseudomonadota TaxID=1224 RepID=A0ABN9JQU4_9RALS|nr:IclR family transcriptional regulator [Ralstonia sp. LMG 18101]CAJ0816680.1 Pectin degradation repressor protein KdgR [Ralstonia sp. LMG 18101]